MYQETILFLVHPTGQSHSIKSDEWIPTHIFVWVRARDNVFPKDGVHWGHGLQSSWNESSSSVRIPAWKETTETAAEGGKLTGSVLHELMFTDVNLDESNRKDLDEKWSFWIKWKRPRGQLWGLHAVSVSHPLHVYLCNPHFTNVH